MFGDSLNGDPDGVGYVFLLHVRLASHHFQQDLEICGLALVS
jgi:hypothetical protein